MPKQVQTLLLYLLGCLQMLSIWMSLKFVHGKELRVTAQHYIACSLESLDYIHVHFACYLNPFPNKPWFLHVCGTSLLKTLWEKEKLLVTSNFSFSHSVFYPFGELSAILIKFEIVVRKLFQFGRI